MLNQLDNDIYMDNFNIFARFVCILMRHMLYIFEHLIIVLPNNPLILLWKYACGYLKWLNIYGFCINIFILFVFFCNRHGNGTKQGYVT